MAKIVNRVLLFICFFIQLREGFAQQSEIDSIKLVIKNCKEDTNKVNAIQELVKRLYYAGEYDILLAQTGEAIKLAQKLGYKKGLASAYNLNGAIYFAQSKHTEALNEYLQSYKIRSENGDRIGLARVLINIGGIYREQGNYPEALAKFYEALKINEELGDKNAIANSLNSLGLIYDSQKNNKESLKNYLAALKIREETGEKIGLAGSYNNVGVAYSKLKEYDKALKYHLLSLKIKKETGDKAGIAISHSNIGAIYDIKGNYKEGLSNHLASLKIREEIGQPSGLAFSYKDLGSYYLTQKNYKEAERYCLKALELSKSIGALEILEESHGFLSIVYSKSGKYEQALKHYKTYINIRDSLLNEENTKKTVRMEMNYGFAKKETAAKLEQEKREAITLAESKKQKIIMYSVCCILVLVIAFSVFVYRSFLQKKRANIEIMRQKEIIEEKQKAILDSIYYARRIQRALITSEKYIERNLEILTKKV